MVMGMVMMGLVGYPLCENARRSNLKESQGWPKNKVREHYTPGRMNRRLLLKK
jgi:hypothetical protein